MNLDSIDTIYLFLKAILDTDGVLGSNLYKLCDDGLELVTIMTTNLGRDDPAKIVGDWAYNELYERKLDNTRWKRPINANMPDNVLHILQAAAESGYLTKSGTYDMEKINYIKDVVYGPNLP